VSDLKQPEDHRFMERALELGRRGIGLTSPNPPVGAVLVRDGRIVGEGWHGCCGGPHAEIEALADARKQKKNINYLQSTLYVTLEPCSTEGRTGACTDAIIAAGITEVVYGCVDPDKKHHGKAREILEAAGVIVRDGVLEAACAELVRGFAKVAREGLPWVIAKAGMTLDGRITLPHGEGQWITSEVARQDAMGLRVRADAIVVGANTARLDNPRLTVRGIETPAEKEQPWRVVLSNRDNLPEELNLFTDAHASRTRILSGEDLVSALRQMVSWGVTTVLVEGGACVLRSFFAARLVDEVIFYVAPTIGLEGIAVTSSGDSGVLLDFRFEEVSRIGPDLKIRALRP
jgi:diaminohydroxyphosphoribosylaminopyrimidine deaminase/5-amino-6-(5-phosphoribosylamino)uracil reductase